MVELDSSDNLSPACKFIRDVFGDSRQTEHDMEIIATHSIECGACAAFIGNTIYEHSKLTD